MASDTGHWPPGVDLARVQRLEAHFEGSAFVRAVACTHLDPDTGVARLVVQPDRAALARSGLTGVWDLIRFEFETLATRFDGGMPLPEIVVSLDDLPRSDSGGVDRRALADATPPRLAPRARVPIGESAAAQIVVDSLARVAPPPTAPRGTPGAPDWHWHSSLEFDARLDSLARTALWLELDTRLGRTSAASPIPWHEALVVGELIALVEQHLGAADAAAGPPDAASLARSPARLAPPDDDGLVAPLSRRSFVRATWMWLVLRTGRILVWPWLRFEVTGLDRIPRDRGVMICPNHESFLDGVVVASLLPFGVLRRAFFLGAAEYFETPAMAALARAIHLVPVDTDRLVGRALSLAAHAIRHGRTLVVFPEGERSIDGSVKDFRHGTALLAEATGCEMVPMALRGMFDLWPRGRSAQWRQLRPWAPARTRAAIGAPVAFDPVRGVETTTRVLRDTVTDLWIAIRNDRAD